MCLLCYTYIIPVNHIFLKSRHYSCYHCYRILYYYYCGNLSTASQKNKATDWSKWNPQQKHHMVKRRIIFRNPLISKLPNPKQELMPHCDALGGSKWVFSQQRQRLCLFKPSSKTSSQFANTQRVQFAGSDVSDSAERRHTTGRRTEPGRFTDCYSWTETWTK